ncbi:Uncharacterised protein [Mycolicibacterium aurum]|uniref:Uncharacterized protein n=1 Tax=Mycolicibacterium aurum TaxID=1791 RepID=A0A3S4VHZ2_MYCAU|nr:hypothetical protein [Mycolicibacterium aurum]VEG51885.1 Uncharacterised protein [Mycolicibacterium aurum]
MSPNTEREDTVMNITTVATVAAGLSAALIGLAAPAAAAPTTGGDAFATISMLEAEGNRVIVNRLSDVPLDQAEVVSVHRGPEIHMTVMDERYDRTYQQTATGHVFYLDVR